MLLQGRFTTEDTKAREDCSGVVLCVLAVPLGVLCVEAVQQSMQLKQSIVRGYDYSP
jgi:hypothetical protein